MYKIKNWFPSQHPCGGGSFNIVLTEQWFKAISKTDLNQEKCNAMIKNMAGSILKGHGINFETNNPEFHFRIHWDEKIGPRVIQVLGNACSIGYDPYSQIGCLTWQGEKILTCHNTDSIKQASMQLTIFLLIAEYLEGEEYERNKNSV